MSEAVKSKYMEIVFEFEQWLNEKLGNYPLDMDLNPDMLFSNQDKLILSIALVKLRRIIEKIR